MEKREPSYIVDGNVNWCGHYGGSTKKLKIELPYDPAIPLLGIYLEKPLNLQRYMYPYVHSSTIYDSQDINVYQQMNG